MKAKRPKVAVIGAGQVGGTTAQRLVEKNLADVVLTDIVEGLPQGKALDMMQAAPVEGYSATVLGTNKYDDIAGSDIVVITAGLPRKPGMTREDLVQANAAIVGPIADQVLKFAPDSIIVTVTNPLDVMTDLVYRRTGFARHRVMGMAGVLDSARFRTFIAMELGVGVADVNAMVLGGHGDSMVPLPKYATVNGVPVTELLSPEQLNRLIERTRNGGAEIVALLKQGSAYYAPSASVVAMVRSILLNEHRLLPVCARLEGEYGIRGVFAGVPAILGSNGIERVVELKLAPEELAALKRSADEVGKVAATVK